MASASLTIQGRILNATMSTVGLGILIGDHPAPAMWAARLTAAGPGSTSNVDSIEIRFLLSHALFLGGMAWPDAVDLAERALRIQNNREVELQLVAPLVTNTIAEG